MVLIHGLIGTLRDLPPLFHQWGITAHAPDLLGYGAHAQVSPADVGLWQQVEHLERWLTQHGLERVHLLGHSVGGAVAMLFAHRYPPRVASIINVEGNFSLNDAFWSAKVAAMSAGEASALLAGYAADPAGWLGGAGITATPGQLAQARMLLANQPASTVHATAGSVVEVTGNSDYTTSLKAVFDSGPPVHLMAGERSASGWDLPLWARQQAASYTLLPGGHMMMLEDPQRFMQAVAGSVTATAA
nr:alpha/beta hydrolase [Pseudomonas sp. RIT-PI-S]